MICSICSRPDSADQSEDQRHDAELWPIGAHWHQRYSRRIDNIELRGFGGLTGIIGNFQCFVTLHQLPVVGSDDIVIAIEL